MGVGVDEATEGIYGRDGASFRYVGEYDSVGVESGGGEKVEGGFR